LPDFTRLRTQLPPEAQAKGWRAEFETSSASTTGFEPVVTLENPREFPA
jgi:hypothetical protein